MYAIRSYYARHFDHRLRLLELREQVFRRLRLAGTLDRIEDVLLVRQRRLSRLQPGGAEEHDGVFSYNFV